MSIALGENPANPPRRSQPADDRGTGKDVSGGSDVVLTDTEAQYHRLIFSGTLTANISVIVPAENKSWWIENATGGAFADSQEKRRHWRCRDAGQACVPRVLYLFR